MEPRRVPLRLLIGSLRISKMYMFSNLLVDLIEALKRRVEKYSFDTICTAAIQNDVTPLRLQCLKRADKDWAVYNLYQEAKLSAEVMAELACLWPVQEERKRRRLLD